MRSLRLLIVIAVLCPFGRQGGAQTPAVTDTTLRAILDSLPGTSITLGEAVSSAAMASYSLKKAEADYYVARGALRRERAVFDPSLFFGINYADREDPTSSFFAGAPILMTVQTDARAGLRWSLPTGTDLEATLSSVRLRTNSGFAFLNPQYNAVGTLTVRQSLLGGLWVSGRKNLTRSEREADAARARYEQQQVAVAAETEKAYWDLYGIERKYAVQKLIRDQARTFLAETEVRARTGLVGPNQVASAKTFLAEQELLLIEREEQIDIASDRLAVLTGVHPSKRFLARDDPPSEYIVEPVEVVLETARARNLSLNAARADVEARRAMARAAGWDWLPSVDFVGSIGGTGLTGAAQDVIFGSDTLRTGRGGSYSDALRQAYRREFPSWSVGIEISIPIGFRRGLGEKERLEAELMAAEERYLDEDRRLEADVRETHREVSNGRRRLSYAREGVDAAQEQVRIGLIEFKNGRTTAFELVRLGADFAAAQNRYSDALVRTARGAATLRQLTSGLDAAGDFNERNGSDE